MNLSIIPWRGITIGTALVALALMAWALRLDHLRGGWKGRFDALTEQAGQVLFATRQAADNPNLVWKDTAGQIVALGESNRALKGEITANNQTIADMAREAVRLRATAEQRMRIAEKAEAQRSAALRKLSDMTITPGERADCMTMLKDSEEAADTVWREAV